MDLAWLLHRLTSGKRFNAWMAVICKPKDSDDSRTRHQEIKLWLHFVADSAVVEDAIASVSFVYPLMDYGKLGCSVYRGVRRRCAEIWDVSSNALASETIVPAFISSPPFPNPPNGAVSRDRLSSLFVDEEKGDSSSNDMGSPGIGNGLMEEAKFLKACGTIPETPVEIKASQMFKQSPPCGDSETSKFRSWLPNKAQTVQPPTPNKLFEAVERSDSPENTSSSCISNAENHAMSSMYSAEGSEAMTAADKTVKIGTVFPSNLETLANGKTRIRSEYVHSVLNPVGNASLLNAMKEKSFSSKDMFDELKESPERLENASPKLVVGVKQTSLVKDL
ncbi:hypothetical protein V6N12_033816 [Hibiscus sabdariffa]